MTDDQWSQIFKSIDTEETGKIALPQVGLVLAQYDTWRYEKTYREEIEEVFVDMAEPPFRIKVLKTISAPTYEFIQNLLCIVNLSTIYMKQVNWGSIEHTAELRDWIAMQMTINLLFGFEIGFELYCHGSLKKAFSRSWRINVEAFCQIVNVLAMWRFLANLDDTL